MSVIVMKVKRVKPHPDADSLFVLQMEAPERDLLQVIVNSERSVGDCLAIALVGSVLIKDGTKIKPANLRGLSSYGLALEESDGPPGTDLTAQYCQEKSEKNQVDDEKLLNDAKHIPWADLGLFHNVRRRLMQSYCKPKITYRAKVKLHGTNSSVQIFPDGKLVVQSRTLIITPERDNYGFAEWVSENGDFFRGLAGHEHITVYGEWCGTGIQKTTAISEIQRKVWALFAIRVGPVDDVDQRFITTPEEITQRISVHPDIFVLPYWGDLIRVDFDSYKSMEAGVASVNEYVENVVESDPWVQETFGNKGPGEGIVLYPTLIENVVTENFRVPITGLMFKAKGEDHQVIKTKHPAQLNPESVSTIQDFVNLFVTPGRCQQGVGTVCREALDMKQMGGFLKWIMGDVQKESEAELEAAGLKWKDVSHPVMRAAREWYRRQF